MRRSVKALVKGQRIREPVDFLRPSRIDLAAKTMFARSYLERNKSKWPEEVYKNSIGHWNGFREFDNANKNSYKAYRQDFLEIIDAYKNDVFKHHNSPIPHTTDGRKMITNGAHRVAAAIATNSKINTIVDSSLNNVYNWNYEFFAYRQGEKPHKKLPEKYLDAMTIEYASLKKHNVFAVIIFPSAIGHRDKAKKHLQGLGEIVNSKTIPKKDLSGIEVIRQIYYGEEWCSSYSGADAKARPTFAGDEDLQVYIIEVNSSRTSMQKEKEYLRSLWGIDKHSIHITDTYEETNRIARMFFHEQTRKLLRYERKQDFSDKMKPIFYRYISVLPKDFIERDKIMIEGSSVLDLLGIRMANDLDYVTIHPRFNYGDSDIENHREYNEALCEENEVDLYKKPLDDIITNPNNHFFYAGCKFMGLEQLLAYKENRLFLNDQKDIDDIKNIKKFMSKMKKLGIIS